MERQRFKLLTDKQKDIILALHKSELTSRQIAEVAECAQSTVIRHLQKFQETGQLPKTERRKATRYRASTSPTIPGSTTPLSVNYKYGDRNYGGMSEIMKKPINEQLNYYQKPIARLSYTNMMEVKHSPSSQMDFRNTSNGLPNEEEDEEMDTLLVDSSAVKSIPNSSLACDSTPILNGNTKYPALEDGMEIDLLDDDMDEELNTTVSDTEDKTKQDETESKKEDLDLFDLDIEQSVVTEKKITNGETTDSSSMRDTGDDLDTLLSKINDLVEDCMEPSAEVDSPTELNEKVVDLTDDEHETEDVTENEAKEPQTDNSADESQVEELEETIELADTTVETEVETKSEAQVVELEEIIEQAEIVETEVDPTNDVETVSEEVTEEIKVGLETEEELIPDELSEIKSTHDISEDASEENGVEVTESDLEIAEEEIPKEVEEEIPEVGAEEIPEVVAEEIPDIVETEAVVVEAVDEEIPAEEIVEEAVTDIESATEEKLLEEVAQKLKRVSEEIASENMDIDGDIVCLDSPIPEDKEEEKLLDSEEPDKEVSVPLLQDSVPTPQEEKEKQTEKEELKEIPEETEVSKEESPKEVISEEPVSNIDRESVKPMEEDDDIFLIEDDDEPMKEFESDTKLHGATEEKSPTEEKLPEKEKLEVAEKLAEGEHVPDEEKLLKEDSKPSNEEEQENEKKTEVIPEESKPAESKEEDDDDIVCLDDSLEETEKPKEEEKKSEEKPIEVSSDSAADKAVDLPKAISKGGDEVESEEQGKPEDEVVEKVSEEEESEKLKEVVAVNVEEIVKEVTKTPVDENEDEASATKPVKAGELLEKVIELTEMSDKVVDSLKEVIKLTEEDAKEASNTISETERSLPKEIPQAALEPEAMSSKVMLIDNDIINLDDDDEDEAAPPASNAEKKDEKSSGEVTADKSLALLSDNSDNARDGVEEKEDKNEPKVSAEKLTPIPSETNSNSSSNLLKESSVTERDESPSEQPPAKRIRLSQDEASSRNSNVSQEDTTSKLLDDDDVMEIIDNDDEESKSLKRVHSTESLSSDFKKPKTDLDSPKVEEEKPPELLEEIIPAKVEPVKIEEKVAQKPVEVKPLPLYPPPNFDTPKICLSLDFLRRFKKSIHKMNKSDLEELVLQKIVEAIVHKSEFSEMRELIEKQEKVISGHRSKITELNKQFRDLEMVHNRVLKDLETKNSQFIMPVKITRAVGLQVFFPNKKFDQPMASLPAPSSVQTASPSSLARSVSTSSNTSSIPEKSPISNPSTINNSDRPASVPSAAGGVNSQIRRGCIQKLTPMRPDGPRSAMIPNRGVTSGVVSSSTPSPMTPKDSSPKILNRQVIKPRLSQSPMKVNASNSSLPQHVHNTHPLSTPPEPEKPKQPQGIATKKTGGVVKSFAASKRIPKSWQSEQQVPMQPSPNTAPTTPLAMVPPQNSLINNSLAAKTPNKSVIDLTDEDDVAPTPSSKPPNVSPTIQKSANNVGVQRVGPYKVSVVPAAQLQQQPRPIPPKQLQQRPQNPPQMGPKPNGTAQNSVRRTPPPPLQRYRHPAPLPNQPIHSSNPLWKLPPARPTIRISNLDSGIVISWTIEDMAKEKYAESTSYQIYAYQETSGPPLVESWRHVGDVKAMLLPMAVTLTQFQEGQRYYFAVRAVDAHNRCGPFSFAKTWS